MASLFVSAKLSKFVGGSQLASPMPADDDFRYYWNAHLFYVAKRKCIIITNKRTLYNIVLLDVLKKDMKIFDAMFYSALRVQLIKDNLFDEPEQVYWKSHSTAINFFPTDNDKKVIGSINEFIYQLTVGISYDVEQLRILNDSTAASYINESPMKAIGYMDPVAKYHKEKLQSNGIKPGDLL
jgi:hypothetical protein